MLPGAFFWSGYKYAFTEEGARTNLTASSVSREATAKISVVGLKVTQVADVTRFIMALTGLGWVSLRQTSVVYKFTTPEDELKDKKEVKQD